MRLSLRRLLPRFAVLLPLVACSPEDHGAGSQRGSTLEPSPAAPEVQHDAPLKDDPAPAPAPEPEKQPTPTPDPPATQNAYDPASGQFVVHEWGTLTSVVDTNGGLLPGLYHEEEDLPGFVADRMAQAAVTPEIVEQKMETPVTYFYAPTPRKVQVKVAFPNGIFTQWFPYVRMTAPKLYLTEPSDRTSIIDPWISTPSNLEPRCQARFEQAPMGGLLDWGEVEILARGQDAPLAGPLGNTTWGFARNTASNPLRVRIAGGEHHEKFLFYRGLGNFTLPLEVTSGGRVEVLLHNRDTSAAMRGALVLNVTRDGAGLARVGDIEPGASSYVYRVPAPSLPLDVFVRELREALTQALLEDGLYADEARAMVDTWERSYFRTPGVRVLYLLPQEHTDRIIPLSITPKPDRVHRTMVIRVEVLTLELGSVLFDLLQQLGSSDPTARAAAKSRILAYGRFAEPYLTSVIAGASGEARTAGLALLGEIRGKRRWAALAVE